DYVLNAQSIRVLILPDAAEPLMDPTANRKAQEEVEKAITKWGRYRLTQEATTADLVIAVKKGTKGVGPTLSGGPEEKQPGGIETTESSMRIGIQKGQPPDGQQSGDLIGPRGERARTGMQGGAEEDAFEVFIGGEQYSTDSAPLWKYIAKDGLKPPTVNAVAQFRKAVEDAEKAKKKQQAQK